MKPRLRPYFDHIIIAVLAAACYVFFFHGLNSIGLIGPDEPRYAAIARDMLLTGDYITPRLNGIPWFEKPVLMYWLSAAGYKIFALALMKRALDFRLPWAPPFASSFFIGVDASFGIARPASLRL